VLLEIGRLGYRVGEAAVTMRPRQAGHSSAGSVASVAFLARALLTPTVGPRQGYRRLELGHGDTQR
jgi:hypothetical protein